MAGPWDDCPKKHYVREEGWVSCANEIRRSLKPRRPTRIFTFCAEHATDIFTLLCRGALSLENGKFSNIVFCEMDPETCGRIQNVLPMAVGIPMELQEVVCLEEEEQEDADNLTYDPSSGLNKDIQGRELQDRDTRIYLHRLFRNSFPFDILNIDLCGFLFKNKEKFPGKTFQTLRKVLQWQHFSGKHGPLRKFSVWLTAKVGPHDLEVPYKQDLIQALKENANRDATLRDLIGSRLGGQSVDNAANNDFANFFTLALPKQLACMLHQEGWRIAPDSVRSFWFSRNPGTEHSYEMLHLVMVIEPIAVPRCKWGGTEPPEVQEGYLLGAKAVLGLSPENVDTAVLDGRAEIYRSKLAEVKQYRKDQWPDTFV